MIKLLKQTISQKQNDSSHWQTIGKHVSVELHWPNSKKHFGRKFKLQRNLKIPFICSVSNGILLNLS